MAVKFSAPKDQQFACRDCPARCCRVPWSIRFGDDETIRYLGEPWVRDRAGAEALDVIERGVLPMRERDRRLQCVFLDDDGLCGMQKQFGHDYIPRACQTFPFGFVRGESGKVIAQLSRLCPSIRDNYGEPIWPQLADKLTQSGGEVKRMSAAMSTRSRVILRQPQYLRIVRSWDDQLAADEPAVEVLARLYDQMATLDRAIPDGVDRATAAQVQAALTKARAEQCSPLSPRAKPSFHARVLYSYALGNLCYPSRVRQPHRVGRPRFGSMHRVRSLGNKLAWMRSRGTVDLLFAPAPVKLARVRRVRSVFASPEGAIVRDYLREVLARRQVFGQPRYLVDVVVDLAMAAVVIARFARCMAVASGRDAVTADDVREGVSVAELVLVSHVTATERGKTIDNLHTLWLSDRSRFRRLLEGEA